MYFGVVPSVSHLRVFGSTCYPVNLVKKKGNHEPKAWPGIFVGYQDQQLSGWRIYLPRSNEFIITAHASFVDYRNSDGANQDPDRTTRRSEPANHDPVRTTGLINHVASDVENRVVETYDAEDSNLSPDTNPVIPEVPDKRQRKRSENLKSRRSSPVASPSRQSLSEGHIAAKEVRKHASGPAPINVGGVSGDVLSQCLNGTSVKLQTRSEGDIRCAWVQRKRIRT